MNNMISPIDMPENEPVFAYTPESPERTAVADALTQLRAEGPDIAPIIDGQTIHTGNTRACIVPHDHAHRLATCHTAGREEIAMAMDAAEKAAPAWAAMHWQDRLAIFQKAAALIAGPYRMILNAATMLNQGKNVFQAEIDAACEAIDFLRFNAHYATRIFAEQPRSAPGIRNQLEYRPLEGFMLAISPFNFTAIAANLVSAPAMLGNTVLWKPASTALVSAHWLMRIFMEAGLPEGVINFLPCSGADVSATALTDPRLAGVHFTGSTDVFRQIWHTVGTHIDKYRSYPRLVGETGGKDFVFVHASADVEEVVAALVRGAFEYQGQKCSAASRAYIPESLFDAVMTRLTEEIATIRIGSPESFENFVNAVIDEAAYHKIMGYIEAARSDRDAEIVIGGHGDSDTGYFIEPTVIVARRPDYRTMVEEVFGPLLTVYRYSDDAYEETLRLCDQTSPYALTGAIFARDRQAVTLARALLVNAAGNFYINDKPTGAVVGQQPFGGSRASGTNDKAGSALNLYRWLSPRTIKETFAPARDYRYPFLA